MTGFGRAGLPPLGPGRGRATLGPSSPSPVQSLPATAAAAEQLTALAGTSTGQLQKKKNTIDFLKMCLSMKGCEGTMLSVAAQEPLEPTASKPVDTAVKTEVER